MNIRFVAAALSVGIASAALWQTHAGAAAKKPVALQYDEIVRISAGTSTPPPPGAFQADYATIMTGVASDSTAAASTPTPAPHKHGFFGQLVQAVTTGSVGDPSGGALDNAMNQLKRFQQGTLTRLTFYKNWMRTDDPVNRTATISKCDIHQYITLDLAHKTYTIANGTAPCVTPTPPVSAGPGRTIVENEAPGTGDMTFKVTATALGPKTLDGIPTTGVDRTLEYSATNSTGSCKNGDFKMLTQSYVSQIAPPRRYCPLPRGANAPRSPESVIVHGGCKPRIHGIGASGFGNTSNRLEMYARMSMAAGGSQPGGFATVTERGNVKWFEQPAADALFSVPPGFTKQ